VVETEVRPGNPPATKRLMRLQGQNPHLLVKIWFNQILVPILGTCYIKPVRLIARSTLAAFWEKHPETKVPLERWCRLTKAAHWASTDEIQQAAPKAKVLNGERVRFEIAGGNYRLVVAFDFHRQIAFVKFIGTHAAYDRIGPLTVSQF